MNQLTADNLCSCERIA